MNLDEELSSEGFAYFEVGFGFLAGCCSEGVVVVVVGGRHAKEGDEKERKSQTDRNEQTDGYRLKKTYKQPKKTDIDTGRKRRI